MSRVRWLCLAAAMTVSPLVAQEAAGDRFIRDLGIVIQEEPGALAANNLDDTDSAESAVSAEPQAGWREILQTIGSRVTYLEPGLEGDLESVRQENERLRALIQQMQTAELAEEPLAPTPSPMISEAAEEQTVVMESNPTDAEEITVEVQAAPRDLYEAYWTGRYDRVTALYSHVEMTLVPIAQQADLRYWCADAYYRLGQYPEAESMLAMLPEASHPLRDDAIVLRGLVLLKQGRRTEAGNNFAQMLAESPESDYSQLAQMTLREIR